MDAKIGACTAQYQLHRTVVLQTAPLLNLVGSENLFKELRDQDVCGIGCDTMDAEREGTAALSWIWKGEGINPDDQATINKCMSFNFLHYI